MGRVAAHLELAGGDEDHLAGDGPALAGKVDVGGIGRQGHHALSEARGKGFARFGREQPGKFQPEGYSGCNCHLESVTAL